MRGATKIVKASPVIKQRFPKPRQTLSKNKNSRRPPPPQTSVAQDLAVDLVGAAVEVAYEALPELVLSAEMAFVKNKN
jgi:hypothetical protein